MGSNNLKEKKKRKFWVTIAVVAVLIIVFGFGIYKYKWDDRVTRIVTKVVPYPAAIVDGGLIRYSDYQNDVRLLKDFYAAEKEKTPTASFPTEEEIKARVLNRMIKDKLSEKLAKRYDISITSDQVNEAFDSTILDQSALGTPADKAKAAARAEQTLQELYGMSSNKFKDKVLYPFLVRRQLEDAIRNDKELNVDKYKKAEEALAELRGGMEFSEAVSFFSEDPSSLTTNGERGMMGRGLLPQEVEDVVFSMEPDDTAVSDIVESIFGYHILKVTDRQDQDGFVTHVQLHEILIKPISLDDYLEAQKKRINIIEFVQ